MSARLCIVLAAAVSLGAASNVASQQSKLDYAFFKSQVEPIFLKKREGHARCYVCHEQSNNAFHLEKLPAGANFWTEQQSRKNFATVSALVVPGDLAASLLLRHPLAAEAGGDLFHSGGRQFASENDPDWKTLAQWVNGKTER